MAAPHGYMAALQDQTFNGRAIEDALNGISVPKALGLELVQRCTVRGIRAHANFGRELYGLSPLFTRALHAQSIMHNDLDSLPADISEEEIPYCIWSPRVPTRETCRALVVRFPQMRYHVGRVCAVAGYTDIYLELDLVPEVTIAEEARESKSHEIFEDIRKHTIKFAVFNDYTRTVVLENAPIACLNGDTQVVCFLQSTQRFGRPVRKKNSLMATESLGFRPRDIDITEDMGISTVETEPPALDPQVLPLLYSPLPTDLPTVDKDLLILSAAYTGSIDRYARLRRPFRLPKEIACLVVGVYHHPLFAKYISTIPSFQNASNWENIALQRALHARAIMSNNPETLTRDTPPETLPYCIWYPDVADAAVYLEVSRRQPTMKLQCARACIVAGYLDAFTSLDPPFDDALMHEALGAPNGAYREHLQRKQANSEVSGETQYSHWDDIHATRNKFHQKTFLKEIGRQSVNMYEWFLNGVSADMASVETSVCVGESARKQFLEGNVWDFDGLYKQVSSRE